MEEQLKSKGDTVKFRITRENYWFSFLGIMVGEFIFSGLFRRGPWWLVVIIALLWVVAGWFVGSWLWNRLFPCYLTLTDTALWVGTIHYAIDSIESISMSIRKKISIEIYFNFPLNPVRIRLWRTEHSALRTQFKQWATVHGVTFQEFA